MLKEGGSLGAPGIYKYAIELTAEQLAKLPQNFKVEIFEVEGKQHFEIRDNGVATGSRMIYVVFLPRGG